MPFKACAVFRNCRENDAHPPNKLQCKTKQDLFLFKKSEASCHVQQRSCWQTGTSTEAEDESHITHFLTNVCP